MEKLPKQKITPKWHSGQNGEDTIKKLQRRHILSQDQAHNMTLYFSQILGGFVAQTAKDKISTPNIRSFCMFLDSTMGQVSARTTSRTEAPSARWLICRRVWHRPIGWFGYGRDYNDDGNMVIDDRQDNIIVSRSCCAVVKSPTRTNSEKTPHLYSEAPKTRRRRTKICSMPAILFPLTTATIRNN